MLSDELSMEHQKASFFHESEESKKVLNQVTCRWICFFASGKKHSTATGLSVVLHVSSLLF